MKLLMDLFFTDYGLMSAIVLLVILGMMGYAVMYGLRNLREEAAAAGNAKTDKQ
jgi:hypothetical protein